MTPSFNLYFIANNDSIYSCLESGIWNDSELNSKLDPITSQIIVQLHENGLEKPATDIKVDKYVRLFKSCHCHLKSWKGNFNQLFIIEIDGRIHSCGDLLQIKKIASAEMQFLKHIMVDRSYLVRVYVYSTFAERILKQAVYGKKMKANITVDPKKFLEKPIDQKKNTFSILKVPPIIPVVPKEKITPTTSSIKNVELVTLEKGDLFKSEMQTLVNTVNCKGVMGKGIALVFKKKFPAMFREYSKRCRKNQVKLGEPYIFNLIDGTKIINFPTKGDWRENSKIEEIEKGLKYLAEHVSSWGITSMAIPPLGCGNGKLKWDNVYPLMKKYLIPLEIRIKIYAPHAENAFPAKRIFTQYPSHQSNKKKYKKS